MVTDGVHCVPRADRPVDSELHSTRTAGKTLGFDVQLADNGIRLAAALQTIRRFGGPLSCGRRAQRAAAIERTRFSAPDTLCSAETLCWWQSTADLILLRGSVVLHSGRPPAARPPLIPRDDQLRISGWWFVNETLFVFDQEFERFNPLQCTVN